MVKCRYRKPKVGIEDYTQEDHIMFYNLPAVGDSVNVCNTRCIGEITKRCLMKNGSDEFYILTIGEEA